MSEINWKVEQDRFMALAYDRCERAARRAFRRWHSRKRDDAVQECVAKAWATWAYNVEKGKDPVRLLGPNIYFSILFVRYDRRIAGRAPHPDVFDYRAKMKRQQLSGQGKASPTDRGEAYNNWINWGVKARTDNPAELAEALEAAGLTLAEFIAA